MEGRSRHCPHLGLKHTRSIRFSSPTPEHRCYIFGDPLPIYVDQRAFCLGERYPECPRFAGREAPPADVLAAAGKAGGRRGGLIGFWQQLSGRERALYLSLIGLLVLIVAVYAVVLAVGALRGSGAAGAVTSTALAMASPSALIVPTVTRQAVPSPVPTTAVAAPTVPTTAVPPPSPTRTPVPPTATKVPPTSTPRPPTAVPVPTATRIPVVPTVGPTQVQTIWSKLYFLGPNKAYYVMVTREGPFTLAVARRALEEMIAGPRPGSGLLRSMPEGMQLLNIYIEGGICFVDLNKSFVDQGAGQAEAMAVVLALTEFSTIDQVQFLVGGTPVGLPGSGDVGPVPRPAYVNYENPYGLDPAQAVALPVYLATPDGQHVFQMVRLVPKTERVAQATIEEMIKGPSAGYQGVALSPIPAGTQIRSISREGSTIVVDFSAEFLQAPNRRLAVDALALGMTDLLPGVPLGVDSVRISVEGQGLGEYWGSAYGGNLYRPLVNPEQ